MMSGELAGDTASTYRLDRTPMGTAGRDWSDNKVEKGNGSEILSPQNYLKTSAPTISDWHARWQTHSPRSSNTIRKKGKKLQI